MITIRIKNMVCDRCIMSVRAVLEDFGYQVEKVTLGKAQIDVDSFDEHQLAEVDAQLKEKGFELIKQKNRALVEQIKAELIEYLEHIEQERESQKLSDYLSEQLHRNYSYLSNTFSNNENLTIEQYLIHLKIERVKELLTYEEMTLSEIAWKLNYSSVQYLSNQFKKVTGETVSSFQKHMDAEDRQSLDAIR